MNTTSRHFVAEFVGTYALVFVGSGAILMADRTGGAGGLLAVAIAHGFVLAIMVSATMNVSGGHLNPAVTIAIMLSRRIPPRMAAVHVVAQLAGATLAALSLKWCMPSPLFMALRGGGQAISSDVTLWQAISLEAIATFFLVFVVFGTCVNAEAPRVGGFAIGLTIAADILAIGPLTGASMNPARSFGPALVTKVWEGQVVFWGGPLIGAFLAALIWDYVLLARPVSKKRDG
jgi:aquaporin Z